MSGVREIAFDTETTGFDARGEDRLTEIGCVELIDFMPTGKTYHTYLKPDGVQLSEKITEITGLTTEFLSDKPLFKDVADDFLAFVGDSPLVAHNADFDRGFINEALKRDGMDPIPTKQFVDTLLIARQKFPGASNSLDALCKRFGISLASRTTHGAIVDAELLAKVYLELNGGRARAFDLSVNEDVVREVQHTNAKQRPTPLPSLLSAKEKAAHAAFVKTEIGETALWNRYSG